MNEGLFFTTVHSPRPKFARIRDTGASLVIHTPLLAHLHSPRVARWLSTGTRSAGVEAGKDEISCTLGAAAGRCAFSAKKKKEVGERENVLIIYSGNFTSRYYLGYQPVKLMYWYPSSQIY